MPSVVAIGFKEHIAPLNAVETLFHLKKVVVYSICGKNPKKQPAGG